MGDIADVDERESRYTPEPWGCVKIGSFFFSHLIRSKFCFFFSFPDSGERWSDVCPWTLFTGVAYSFVFRTIRPSPSNTSLPKLWILFKNSRRNRVQLYVLGLFITGKVRSRGQVSCHHDDRSCLSDCLAGHNGHQLLVSSPLRYSVSMNRENDTQVDWTGARGEGEKRLKVRARICSSRQVCACNSLGGRSFI
jgi:hypothetical protein